MPKRKIKESSDSANKTPVESVILEQNALKFVKIRLKRRFFFSGLLKKLKGPEWAKSSFFYYYK
jgi:hypothetical protein